MLLNTLQSISKYLRDEKIIDNEKLQLFIDEFKIYKLDEYVYPQYFINSIDLREDECYKIFSQLVYLGILKQVYKVICPHCQHVSNKVLETFNELEEYIVCEECDDEVFDIDNPLKFVILFYKVVSE